MEAFVKSRNKPQFNVNDLYLLNTQAVMVFLHKNGLSNGFDFDKLNNHVEKLAAKHFEYKIKCEVCPDISLSSFYEAPYIL